MAYKALECVNPSDIADLGVPSDAAVRLHGSLAQIVRDCGDDAPATWRRISTQLLNPELPFFFHQMMYYGCYKDFGPDPPAWVPDPNTAILTNIGQLLERQGREFLGPGYRDPISSFPDFHEFSVSNPEVFWKAILDEMCVSFSVPPQCILLDDQSAESQLLHPGGLWLPGAYVNPAKNCLSVNRKRDLNDTMVIWRNEGDDEVPVNTLTLKELRSEVSCVRSRNIGVGEGICNRN